MELFSFGVDFFRVHDNEEGVAISKSGGYPNSHEFGTGSSDDLHHDAVPSPLMPSSCEEDDTAEKAAGIDCQTRTGPKKKQQQQQQQQQYVLPAAFEVLRRHGSRRLKFDGKTWSTGNEQPQSAELPTEMIIQLAAEKFIQSAPQSGRSKLSALNHPYPSSLLSHSDEDSRGVQLVQNLLSCAEKVDEKQHERALKFLKECEKHSSPSGTPIQRMAFYFTEALFSKIAWETGRITPKVSEKPLDSLEPLLCPNILIAFHKEHPHSQITKFAGMQAIVDHLGDARKVHVVDFQIRSGVQWIILMQALAARTEHPIHYLKLTAVGTKGRLMLEDTGRQLAAFAESLDLKFIFKLVMVENILDLREDHFERDADEAVAFYAAYSLMSLIGRIDHIDHVMGVIRNINPCVMVVTEVEANCNAPTFIGRFVESLFFFGAYFDSLAECMKDDEPNRRFAESTMFRSSINNILAAEGKERKVRHVNINVWRAFFVRFGLVEVELSLSALDQVTVVLQGFSSRSSCTVQLDGKSLIMGWKGTPLTSLSVWKFK
ncbi:DELLA protein RGL1-like [Andrographis paniculata]|uniref:DELLA protein RGL1-like n=1 Tax=Andrographis paniculata TaxID=175694 RepID=UPI0021E893A1|nr:DELLA protein RGL1-like [Andrographis paniculata]